MGQVQSDVLSRHGLQVGAEESAGLLSKVLMPGEDVGRV